MISCVTNIENDLYAILFNEKCETNSNILGTLKSKPSLKFSIREKDKFSF